MKSAPIQEVFCGERAVQKILSADVMVRIFSYVRVPLKKQRCQIAGNIDFLYTNIGRGHPFYLDGIAEALIRKGYVKLIRRQRDVFEVSGGLSLTGWKLVRFLYRKGWGGGLIGRLYAYLRSNADYNRPNVLLDLLGREIRDDYFADINPVVVAHPTLVAILRNRKNLIYQHGEVVTPREAVVRGAEYVLVPTVETAEPFYEAGYNEGNVLITGLCVESTLARQAKDAFENRLRRITGQEPLTGAFFSSGAEPHPRVSKLVMSAAQAVASGGRAILFAAKGGRYLNAAKHLFDQYEIDYRLIDSSDQLSIEWPHASIICYESRRELNIFTASLFGEFDYFVSPPHERTNWALGLGLPMFVIGPSFGPYAPLNRKRLLEAEVAEFVDTIDDAMNFGRCLTRMRLNGTLYDQTIAGWGKYRIDGFEKIAEFFVNKFGSTAL